eukprot:TRINITY_DN3500_c0_g1_i2.p1 TRINITY_DN3500_c0_g1~~TRINITY_DN3500_c0_g1_i2.p1  ORF type:complete len:479 (-),score=80.86 TRINITY_DN3500_c0_g1_i2:1290-2726(-)
MSSQKEPSGEREVHRADRHGNGERSTMKRKAVVIPKSAKVAVEDRPGSPKTQFTETSKKNSIPQSLDFQSLYNSATKNEELAETIEEKTVILEESPAIPKFTDYFQNLSQSTQETARSDRISQETRISPLRATGAQENGEYTLPSVRIPRETCAPATPLYANSTPYYAAGRHPYPPQLVHVIYNEPPLYPYAPQAYYHEPYLHARYPATSLPASPPASPPTQKPPPSKQNPWKRLSEKESEERRFKEALSERYKPVSKGWSWESVKKSIGWAIFLFMVFLTVWYFGTNLLRLQSEKREINRIVADVSHYLDDLNCDDTQNHILKSKLNSFLSKYTNNENVAKEVSEYLDNHYLVHGNYESPHPKIPLSCQAGRFIEDNLLVIVLVLAFTLCSIILLIYRRNSNLQNNEIAEKYQKVQNLLSQRSHTESELKNRLWGQRTPNSHIWGRLKTLCRNTPSIKVTPQMVEGREECLWEIQSN